MNICILCIYYYLCYTFNCHENPCSKNNCKHPVSSKIGLVPEWEADGNEPEIRILGNIKNGCHQLLLWCGEGALTYQMLGK